MSTGSASIPLLKAAPEADQVAERLAGGPWAGLELCLMPGDVRDDASHAARRRRRAPRRRRVRRRGGADRRGARVLAQRRVRPGRPARRRGTRGIERSARFAAAIGSPVLTIHLFIPQTPAELRASGGVDEPAVEAFLRCFAGACGEHGRHAADRERAARAAHAHRRRLPHPDRGPLARPARVARRGSRARLHARHLPRRAVPARSRAPTRRCSGWRARTGWSSGATSRSSGRASEVAHVSDAAGCSARACPTAAASCDLDPVVARIGELVPYVVAEINEPDPAARRT